jgi:NTP pyrophosphatase (non-canonical NTP hydrolase)
MLNYASLKRISGGHAMSNQQAGTPGEIALEPFREWLERQAHAAQERGVNDTTKKSREWNMAAGLLLAGVLMEYDRRASLAAPPATPEREDQLTIRQLQRINTIRAARWHADGLAEWTPMEWAGAMAGEAGEAVNAAKKLRRLEKPGTKNPDSRGVFTAEEYKLQIGKEAADTVIYAALLCERIGIELQESIQQVFNAKSEECGFPERL